MFFAYVSWFLWFLKINVSHGSVIGYLINSLSLTVQRMCQWENFENQPTFGGDLNSDKVGRFLGHRVDTITGTQ